MEPMKPMQPMEPMKPMKGVEPWWPGDLGQPSTSGSQDGMRYAFFSEKRRLLIEKDGTVSTYDSGDHDITGVSQTNGREGLPTFTDDAGTVDVAKLKKVG